MELNSLVRSSHGNAVSKGFYDLPNLILDKMAFEGFSDEQVKAVKDAFIAQRLMLITSELSEALEASRTGKKAFLQDYERTGDFKATVKDSFEDELADVQIRLCDLSGWLGIDLQKHIELKAIYNSKREKMHGKAF